MSKKEYLGDGVYVDFDGYHIVLTTENGIQKTNEILLEPSILAAFDRYREWLMRKLGGNNAPEEQKQ